MEKLKERVVKQKQVLDESSTDNRMAQLALDKTAEEYRQLHLGRQEVFVDLIALEVVTMLYINWSPLCDYVIAGETPLSHMSPNALANVTYDAHIYQMAKHLALGIDYGLRNHK